MRSKKIRLAIAIGVAVLVHILSGLFFLCLNTSPQLINAENITQIEIHELADSPPTQEMLPDSPPQNIVSSRVSGDSADIQPSDPMADTVGQSSDKPVSPPASTVGSGSVHAQQSTTAASGSRQGVPVVMPRILHSVQPIYPQQAKNAGAQGRVYLRILVNTQGQVEQVAIATSSGRADLDEAAGQAVSAWRFSPAKDERGRLVSCYIRLPIEFWIADSR